MRHKTTYIEAYIYDRNAPNGEATIKTGEYHERLHGGSKPLLHFVKK